VEILEWCGGGGSNCCGDREGEGGASTSNVGVVIVKIVI